MGALHEGLHAVREVKMLGREPSFAETFEACERALAGIRVRQEAARALPRLLSEAMLMITMIAVAAALLASGEGAAVPLLGLYAYAGLRLLPVADRLVDAVHRIRAVHHPLDRMLRDLDRFASEGERGPGTGPGLRAGLELVDVGFTYPGSERPALRGVGLSIRRGECVGIVGPTGSGKSTLMMILSGLAPPTAGTLRVDGREIDDPVAWRRSVGLVPQSVHLLDAPLRANVVFGADDVDESRLEAALAEAGLDEVVAHLPRGVDTVVGSGGPGSRAESASGSRSPAPSTRAGTCCCSTRRRRPWTVPPSATCSRPSTATGPAGRWWWWPTGSARSGAATGSWCSAKAPSSPRARSPR